MLRFVPCTVGGSWHPKFRLLAHRSGLYVLRRKGASRASYVGESHSGTLAATCQRHFQHWKGVHVSVAYPGARDRFEVALVPTPPHTAATAAASLAERLRPVDQPAARRAAADLWERYNGRLRRAKRKRGAVPF